MKLILTFSILFSSILVSAQTDIIEIRSRNADVKKYDSKRISDKSDHISSNFGMLPPDETFTQAEMMHVSKAVLDSVKCVSDGVAIMYTSSYCKSSYFPNTDLGIRWLPGVDTIYNHPLFRNSHSLDSLKIVLDRDYKFALPSDSTKFIGYDNVKVESKEDRIKPVKVKRKTKTSDGGLELILLLFVPLGVVFILLKLTLPKLSIVE